MIQYQFLGKIVSCMEVQDLNDKKILEIRFGNDLSTKLGVNEQKVPWLSSATTRTFGKSSPLGRGGRPGTRTGHLPRQPVGLPGDPDDDDDDDSY